MRINSIQNYNYTYNNYPRKSQQNQPNFGSNYVSYFDNAGKVVNRSTTCFFRSDFNWQDFVLLLKDRYKWQSKVNIHNYACSDGSEPYSLTMMLLEETPEFAKKCFPIIAKDKEPQILTYAEKGICGAHDLDIYQINYYTRNRIHNYFNFTKEHPIECNIGLIAKQHLRDKIHFSQADITKDIATLKTNKNNVFLCRNMWLYIPKEKQEPLVQQMTKKAQNRGLIVIGEHDRDKSDVVELLKKYEFKEIQENVFAPINNNNEKFFSYIITRRR